MPNQVWPMPRPRNTGSPASVLRLIRGSEATTRAELMQATGLGRLQLGQRLDALLSRQLVVADTAASTGGRPAHRYTFNPRAGVILAADLGATHGRLAVADLGGTTLADEPIELTIAQPPGRVLDEVLRGFHALLDRVGVGADLVWVAGIGVPGPVDFASGRPVRPPIMPGWDGFDIRAWFSQQLACEVVVDNDVNVMALGEYWRGWYPDVRDLLYIKVGTGIGAGLITGAAVFRGARGAAGDIGHVRIANDVDVLCDCGNTNCLEALAGGRAIAGQLRELGLETAGTRDVIDLIAAGQRDARRLVRAAGRRLGEALHAAVNLLNPEVIVVGGDLAEAHEELLAGVREVVYQQSTALATQSLLIKGSWLRERAGVEGCVALALEHVHSEEVLEEVIRSDAVSA